jgi:hypothetical protein
MRWPDIEALLIRALSGVGGAHRVATNLPADLSGNLPLIQVTRVGGADDHLSDYPVVDLDCFAATRYAAGQLAATVREAVLGLRHTDVGGLLVDAVDTTAGPIWVDYADATVQRYVLTVEITIRPATT